MKTLKLLNQFIVIHLISQVNWTDYASYMRNNQKIKWHIGAGNEIQQARKALVERKKEREKQIINIQNKRNFK